MSTKFYGREQELKRLNSLISKKTASLVVVKGRRRIGKSRLIEEFSKSLRSVFFTGLAPEPGCNQEQQKQEFSVQFEINFGQRPKKNSDWSFLFWELSQKVNQGPWLIVFDEINWMGSEDHAFLGKLKTAWDTYFKKNPQLILILSGSMSKWIDENILSSTGYFGRISLELTLGELPLNICNKFWRNTAHTTAPFEKFKILSVTGGVPRYLEEIDPHKTSDENIFNLAFTQDGILVNEFDRIFSDLFNKKSSKYKSIVELLVYGNLSLEQIRLQLKMEKGGVLSKYLDDLVETGYLARDYTWHIASEKKSTLSLYRLKDCYLRFYLRYIYPRLDQISKNRLKAIPSYESIMGLQFENLVVNQAANLHQLLNIRPEQILYDNPYFQKETLRHKACQIDYLIQTQYKNLYLCEIKFQRNPIGVDIIQEINQKKQRLNTGKHASLRFVLIHVNGVTDALQDADFFSHIIDFGQLLNEK